jgi:hypothetical protein
LAPSSDREFRQVLPGKSNRDRWDWFSPRSLFVIAVNRYIPGMVSRTYGRGRPLNAPAAFILIVAILLIAVVPVYAQAQSPSAPKVSKDDAQKVVAIISGDKAKIKNYCDILNLGEQMERAYENRDLKLADELLQKINTMEKTLGPEYAALVDRLWQLDPKNEKLGAEIMLGISALNMLCGR